MFGTFLTEIPQNLDFLHFQLFQIFALMSHESVWIFCQHVEMTYEVNLGQPFDATVK